MLIGQDVVPRSSGVCALCVDENTWPGRRLAFSAWAELSWRRARAERGTNGGALLTQDLAQIAPFNKRKRVYCLQRTSAVPLLLAGRPGRPRFQLSTNDLLRSAMRSSGRNRSLALVPHHSTHLHFSEHHLLHLARARTVFSSRAFRHTAPTVWNSLPLHLTDDFNTAFFINFQRKTRRHIFIPYILPCHVTVSAPAIRFWLTHGASSAVLIIIIVTGLGVVLKFVLKCPEIGVRSWNLYIYPEIFTRFHNFF